jgi:lysophospholipase L1-like esterase
VFCRCFNQIEKVPFIEPRTGTAYDSSGKGTDVAGPWITEANKARYISDDGFHPNDDGLVYVAQRMFDAVQALS